MEKVLKFNSMKLLSDRAFHRAVRIFRKGGSESYEADERGPNWGFGRGVGRIAHGRLLRFLFRFWKMRPHRETKPEGKGKSFDGTGRL
jgi:hypothetical protein